MTITVVTQAGSPAVTLDQAKRHLRYVLSDQDDLIGLYVQVATTHVQRICEFAIGQQVWMLTLDAFPATIELPGGAVSAVTTVAYVDQSGTDQSLQPTDFRLDSKSTPARLTPTSAQGWPFTAPVTNAVSVTYTVGSDDVPAPLKSAILLIAGDLFENRQQIDMDSRAVVAESPTVRRLIFPYRRVLP